MNALHPAFAEILGAAQQAPAALRRAAYVSALIKHDWEYDWSDDGRVFREGVAQRAALRAKWWPHERRNHGTPIRGIQP
jgi:hypothetical protein